MQDAGCKMQETGCRMQDAGCSVQDAGCRMQDAGCRMHDAGCRMQYQIYEVYSIHSQILTSVGHRFGYQSGLYDSSGQTIF